MSLKNPVTAPKIDPGTVRLVAQRLNNYATPGPILQFIRDEYKRKLWTEVIQDMANGELLVGQWDL